MAQFEISPSSLPSDRLGEIGTVAIEVMTTPRFVICMENSDYPVSLKVRKIYRVVADRDAAGIGHLRIIDESGEDYLYPESCFIDAGSKEDVCWSG